VPSGRVVILLALIMLALAGACAPVDPGGVAESRRPGEAVVTRVVDGDTVEVDIDGRRESVRLIGIDTPEIAHPPDGAECFGPEASAYVHDLLPPGTRVVLARDVESRDAYDRLLAYVTRVDDDLLVNLALVEAGYAEILAIEPNTVHAPLFAGAEADARARGVGLWSACT